MEYLEIAGQVKLKADFDQVKVNSVLKALSNIESAIFGFIEVSLKGDVLSIHADGEIAESNSIKALFLDLQDQFAIGSSFKMFSVRWEFYVMLSILSLPTQTALVKTTQTALMQ
ncbi:MAG: hypothetical protein O2971_05750 [Proteobacteria bacterium]|nr:hypothetical protein [Pseudomonadota bacterium]